MLGTGKYVLISVYNKRDIFSLAKNLLDSGYKIIATEGTGLHLSSHGIDYIPCESVSKNPKIFDGEIKTMSFAVEGGLFFDRKNDLSVIEAKKCKIKQIDILICNIENDSFLIKEKRKFPLQESMRKLDFGGITMIRVAVHNLKNVTVVTDPDDYPKISNALKKGVISDSLRYILAKKAWRLVLKYDRDIYNIFFKKEDQ
jgi:phosphoribosylaminoimidazolecarboxamide formyltransferase/IMP cyclohydrolase